ncbi:MAG: MBOAT family O-acyltransferase [Chthoniobacteraceae bacterium]
MLFSTPFFLFVFLPLFFGLYWFLPARRQILLAGSLIFYAWSEPLFIWVVLASACFDWFLGRLIYALPPGRGRRKFLVGLGVASNLGLLIYAKYTAFAVVNLNILLTHFGTAAITVPKIALPLGVSFIVFEKITYLVDLYRHVAAPAVSLFDYLNYVFLFPKLLAGPIVKYHDISGQLTTPSHRYEDVRDGTIRFIHGFAKKVLIADALAPLVDVIFNLPAHRLDISSAWLGVICFTLQIYFDFSGYSDMAIGLGRILGFRLLENFNNPYLATSFTDFWRRWHISLSSWIKEYLYIPLGGSRVSTARSYVNLCICFLLSGLWHGASWNFVIWGCFHGAVLVADRAFWLRWQKALPRFVNIALTFLLVSIAWVFFRCDTFTHATAYLHALVVSSPGVPDQVMEQTDASTWAVIAAGLVLVFAPLLDFSRFKKHLPIHRTPALAFCLVLLVLTAGRMAVSNFHPFLYFRF